MDYKELIKIGSTNATAVKAIKARLNLLMHSNLDVTSGVFGESTKKEVERFQFNHQLLDDGIVGQLTWSILFSPPQETAPNSKVLSERAIEVAETQTYVREKTGKNDGKEVEAYLASIGLDKGYAWCMAFMYWIFDKASKDLQIANPLTKTGGVLRMYNENPSKRQATPKRGDIFIMDFGKGQGHTGIVTSVKGNEIFTIEGNTSVGGSRDGDGVYRRSRKISTIKSFLRF